MIKIIFNEDSDLLKAGLCFSVQPDKLRKYFYYFREDSLFIYQQPKLQEAATRVVV